MQFKKCMYSGCTLSALALFSHAYMLSSLNCSEAIRNANTHTDQTLSRDIVNTENGSVCIICNRAGRIYKLKRSNGRLWIQSNGGTAHLREEHIMIMMALWLWFWLWLWWHFNGTSHQVREERRALVVSQITASGISDASAVEVRHDFVNMWFQIWIISLFHKTIYSTSALGCCLSPSPTFNSWPWSTACSTNSPPTPPGRCCLAEIHFSAKS